MHTIANKRTSRNHPQMSYDKTAENDYD